MSRKPKPSPTTELSPLAADLLRGARQIAAYLNMHEKAVYGMVERGKKSGQDLPVFRMGSLICARKSELDAHLRANRGAAA